MAVNGIPIEAVWASLPVSLREEIDGLLCQHKHIKALVAFVEQPGQPRQGIPLGKELLSYRQVVLYEQGLLQPEPETTVAQILDKAASLDRAPVAIEARWDGDYRGWMVDLMGILPRSPSGFDEVRLAMLPPRRDSGTTPEEEALAKGQAVADRLGVPFYFADPENPDINHPRWWDTLG